MVTTVDHNRLLGRCANGDHSALRALYDAEGSRMLGVAARILRRRDLAEEAVHDAFVRIWEKAASFDPQRGSGRTWMYAIVRHRALNLVRDSAREELTGDTDDFDALDEAADPEAVMDHLSHQGRLHHCLGHLPNERRRAVLLAFAGGLTHGEVAGRLRLPLGTVKAWIRRSLIALKECLQ